MLTDSLVEIFQKAKETYRHTLDRKVVALARDSGFEKQIEAILEKDQLQTGGYQNFEEIIEALAQAQKLHAVNSHSYQLLELLNLAIRISAKHGNSDIAKELEDKLLQYAQNERAGWLGGYAADEAYLIELQQLKIKIQSLMSTSIDQEERIQLLMNTAELSKKLQHESVSVAMLSGSTHSGESDSDLTAKLALVNDALLQREKAENILKEENERLQKLAEQQSFQSSLQLGHVTDALKEVTKQNKILKLEDARKKREYVHTTTTEFKMILDESKTAKKIITLMALKLKIDALYKQFQESKVLTGQEKTVEVHYQFIANHLKCLFDEGALKRYLDDLKDPEFVKNNEALCEMMLEQAYSITKRGSDEIPTLQKQVGDGISNVQNSIKIEREKKRMTTLGELERSGEVELPEISNDVDVCHQFSSAVKLSEEKTRKLSGVANEFFKALDEISEKAGSTKKGLPSIAKAWGDFIFRNNEILQSMAYKEAGLTMPKDLAAFFEKDNYSELSSQGASLTKK